MRLLRAKPGISSSKLNSVKLKIRKQLLKPRAYFLNMNVFEYETTFCHFVLLREVEGYPI